MKTTTAPDKTAKKIVTLARTAEALGESSALTEIAGVLVTIHAKKFETPIDHDRFASLNLTKRFHENLWIHN